VSAAARGGAHAVTVVIPVRNGGRFLPELLAALEGQTLDAARFDVVFVDDGSTDETPALLAAWSAAVPARRRIVRREGGGPAKARNAGVAVARGDWVAFTDADVVPDPTWLEEIVAAARAGDAAAIEGRVDPWTSDDAGPELHHAVNRDGGLYITANMAYRRDLLEQLGGFDERFEEPFLEDSDLAFRALDAGVEIVFAPQARTRHRPLTRSPLSQLRGARRARWFALVAQKHPERYKRDLRPRVPPLTRADAHILAAAAGLAAAPLLRGTGRLVAAAAVTNGVRVIVRTGRVDVPAGQRPRFFALALALPVARVWWLVEGSVRFRRFRR
jgi:GT2 family glycosyltransferase